MSETGLHEFGGEIYEEEPCIRYPKKGEVYLDLARNPIRTECDMWQMRVVLKKVDK